MDAAHLHIRIVGRDGTSRLLCGARLDASPFVDLVDEELATCEGCVLHTILIDRVPGESDEQYDARRLDAAHELGRLPAGQHGETP